MPEPEYSIKLFSDFFQIKQLSSNTVLPFGLDGGPDSVQQQLSANAGYAFGDTLGKTHWGNQIQFDRDVTLKKVKVNLWNFGTIWFDNVRMGLWNSDGSTLLQTSTTIVAGNTLPLLGNPPLAVEFSFNYKLLDGVTYTFAVYRDGAIQPNDYYYVQVNTAGGYPNGEARYSNDGASTWATQSGEDLYFVATGETFITHAGNSFKIIEFDSSIITIGVWLFKVGTPTGVVNMEIRNTSGAILATSGDSHSTEGNKEFTFDLDLNANETYYFFAYRSVVPDASNYWTLDQFDSDIYADGVAARIKGEDIIDETGDCKFTLAFENIDLGDIVDDVVDVIINTGRNDVDGTIEQGILDVTIENKDGRYSVNNEDSDLFGFFRVNTRIEVTITYDSIEYDRFSGFITFIQPLLQFDTRTTQIKALDRFSKFQETKVSIGLQQDKTASELVIAILQDMGLSASEYDVQSDPQELEDVTWNNVNALEKLASIVEVGQHHHFIDGAGKYIFKNNQWLSDNTPKFSFVSTTDGIVSDGVVDANIDDDINGVKNKISVKWSTNFAVEEREDSQLKYGLREFELDNELMPDANDVYASFIAEYIADLFEEPGNSLVLSVANLFPEILNVSFGDVIKFTDDFSGFNAPCNVLAITEQFDTKGNHTVDWACRKWVLPPDTGSFFALEPFQGDEWLTFDDDIEKISQGFEITSGDGVIYDVDLTLKHNLPNSTDIALQIFAADGSGLPTGSALATSNVVNFPAGAGNATYNFTFPVEERPTLTQNTDYCFVLDTPLSFDIDGPFTEIVPFVFGTGFDESTNTIAFVGQQITTPSVESFLAWVKIHIDLPVGGWSRIRLYTVDGGGEPDVLIATSEKYFVQFSSETFILNFSESQRPVLDPTTKYFLEIAIIGGSPRGIRAKSGNPYAGGTGWRLEGSTWVENTNLDYWFEARLYHAENKWEIWGQDTDQYANQIPAEYDGSVWSSLHPWDFYFLANILSV